ncbi:MAG TPA: DUF748 domain-containing protein, partial [Candidatus Methylomirabilis sp.]|nr:DUF748 domain-containing protein [Candidatus Methylomirabilis sp.]
MTRRLKLLLSLAVILVVLTGLLLWALPEIARRVALAQIPKTFDRAAAIEDVDLNLFTGRVAIKKLRLSEHGGPDAFLQFDRLDLRVSYRSLFRANVHLTELRLTGLAIKVVRTAFAEFNFSDLMQKFRQPETTGPETTRKPQPSRLTFTIDRVDVTGASILLVDHASSPPTEWRLDPLGIQARGLTTRPDQPPGALEVDGRLNNEAALTVAADPVRLTPLSTAARVTLADFDLARLRPYLPPDLPAALQAGKLGADLRVTADKDGEAPPRATVTGDVRLDRLAVVQREHPDPFLVLGHLGISIKQADVVT